MRRRTDEPVVRTGGERPPTAETLAALRPVLTARGAAADWTRYRVLALALTLVVLTWGATRVAALVLDAPGLRTDPEPAPAAAAADGPGDAATIGAADDASGLRTDLFRVPRPRKTERRKEPKTNPIELLNLVELQGVLGGERPRAMIRYRRTEETVTVSVGDDLGEFEVMEIRNGSVVLKWRDELFELSL